jgi:hypothetical protein
MTPSKGVGEEGTGENIWASREENNRRLKIFMSSLMIYTPHKILLDL